MRWILVLALLSSKSDAKVINDLSHESISAWKVGDEILKLGRIVKITQKKKLFQIIFDNEGVLTTIEIDDPNEEAGR